MNQEKEIFEQALEMVKPEDRLAFLSRACDGDPALLARVQALLRAHQDSAGFLPERPGDETVVIPSGVGKPGDRIGRYCLRELLGEGGWGVVYVAEQEEPVRRRVALKVIKPGMDSHAVISRFQAERQALAMMDHPNIARVLDAGTTDGGLPYFVMELVRGVPITTYCDTRKLSTAERLDLFVQVCRAVQHAHQKGIIHRDLKPSNTLVTLHDGTPMPKVIDFGVAKATGERLTDQTVYTHVHQFIGTPAYVSPEQAEMSGLDIDTRADIYSLGVLLYELLTGRPPFNAAELLREGFDQMRRTILEREPVRPSTRLSTLGAQELAEVAQQRRAEGLRLVHCIRGDLDWIVMKALEKDRTRRYDTASAMATDVHRHLNNEPIAARPPSVSYRFQKLVHRNRLAMAATAAVALALVLGTVASLWQAARATRAEKYQIALRTDAESAQAGEALHREKAEAHALEALRSAEHARQLLYAADMHLAQQALKANNLGRARRLLDRHRPAPGKTDLRGWEWRYLWEQCQSDAITVLPQGGRSTRSVSFSPEGRSLAVGYWTGEVELWDLAARQPVWSEVPRGADGGVATVEFSPDGRTLAVSRGTREGFHLLDARSGEERFSLRLDYSAHDVVFSPDGQWLAMLGSGVRQAPLLLLEVESGEIISSNSVPSSLNRFSRKARFSPDRTRLYYAGGTYGHPRLFCAALPDWNVLWEMEGERDVGFTAMDLSPDGRTLVTSVGYAGSTIRLRDSETGRVLSHLEGHTSWISELAFSPDGTRLASSSSDQTIRLWDTGTWKEIATLRGHGDEVHAVDFSSDGALLATASKSGPVMLWNAESTLNTGGNRQLPADLRLARFLPGGQFVIAQSTNDAWRIIELKSLRRTDLKFASHERVSWSPPNFLCAHDSTNRAMIFEVRDGRLEPFTEFATGGAMTNRFAVSRAAGRVAWSDGSTNIYVRSLNAGGAPSRIESDVIGLSPWRFSTDGKLLLAVADGPISVARIFEVATGARRLEIEARLPPFGRTFFGLAGDEILEWLEARGDAQSQTEAPKTADWFQAPGYYTGIALARDGRTFAVPTEAGPVVLFDAQEAKEIARLHGHIQSARGAAFSRDGRRLASSCCGSEAVRLWDVTTGQELLTLAGQGSVLDFVQFSDDGDTLLVGSPYMSGLYQFWRAPSWEAIEAAEREGNLW